MIKNLIFDFGKVLVDYDFYSALERMFGSREVSDEFIRVVKTQEQQEREDRGDEPFEQMCDLLKLDYPQFERELEIYKHNYTTLIIGEMPGMHDLLARLKEMGYKLYGLSNWCNQVYKTMKQYDIFGFLDGFIVSSDVQIIKPDLAIYTALLEKYGLKAEECLFADDRQVNIDAALKVGMDAVLYTDYERYVADLRARGIEI